MKMLFLLFALVSPLFGAGSVTSGTTVYTGGHVTGAATGAVSGYLADGGIGATPNQAWGGQIVLFTRDGVTSFAAMAAAAKSVGATGVIIANNVAGAANTATLEPSTSTIPAVTVSQTDGVAIRRLAGSVVKVSTTGSAPPPPVLTGLPSPVGHAGEILASDGTKWVLAKAPADWGSATMAVEVAPGKPVSIAISAEGSPPISYQWHKNGIVMPGATTAVLSIASATPADAGKYLCMVTNPISTAPSGACVVIVK